MFSAPSLATPPFAPSGVFWLYAIEKRTSGGPEYPVTPRNLAAAAEQSVVDVASVASS